MDLKTRIVITSKDNTSAGFASTKRGLKALDGQVNKIRRNIAGLFAAGVTLTFAKSVVDTADKMTLLEGRLKTVTDSSDEFNSVQKALFESAQDTGSAYEDNIDVFARMNPAIKQLGGNSENTVGLLTTINQSLRLSGASAAESSSVVTQLSQAFASGVLRGDEFNSIMENGGRLAQALADGLGVNIGQLRAMAEAGELSSVRVIRALQSQSDAIATEFRQLPDTIDASLNRLNNAWQSFLNTLNKTSNTTNAISSAINAIAENFEVLASLAIKAALAIAFAYAVKGVKSLIAYRVAVKASIAESKALAAAQLESALAAQTAALAAEKTALAELNNARMVAAGTKAKIVAAKTDAQRLALQHQYNIQLARVIALEKAHIATTKGIVAANTRMKLSYTGLGAAIGAALLPIFIAVEGLVFINEQWGEGVRLLGLIFLEFFRVIKDGWGSLQSLFDAIGQGSDRLSKNVEKLVSENNAKKIAEQTEQANERVKKSFKETETNVGQFFEALKTGYELESRLIDQRAQKQVIDLSRRIIDEEARERAITRVLINSQNEKLRLTENYAREKLAVLERNYRRELAATKNAEDAKKDILEKLNREKVKIYQELVKSAESHIKELISLEQQHLNKARDFARQRRQLEHDTELTIRDFKREFLNDYQKRSDIASEQEELRDKAEIARKKGNSKELERVARRLMDLALERGRLEKQIASDSGIANDKGRRAVRDYREAVELLDKALAGRQGAEQAAANAARAAYDKATKALKTHRDELDKLHEKLAVSTNSEHIISDNYDEVMARLRKLDGTVTRGKHIIDVVEQKTQARRLGGPIVRLSTGGFPERRGALPGFGGGDKIKALLEAGEFIVRKESVKKYGLDYMNKINRGEVIKRKSGGPVGRFASGGEVTVNELLGGEFKLKLDDSDLVAMLKALRDYFTRKERADEEAAKLEQLKGNFGGALGLPAIDLTELKTEFNAAFAEAGDALRSQIDAATQRGQEQIQQLNDSYLRAVEDIDRGQKTFNDNIDSAIRDIRRKGLTEEEVYVDKIKEIREKQAEAQRALAAGDIEEAERLNAEIVRIAQDISGELKDGAGNIIVDQQQAAETAIAFLEQARTTNDQIAAAKRNQNELRYQADLANLQALHNQEMANIQAEHQKRLQNIAAERDARLQAAIEASADTKDSATSTADDVSNIIYSRWSNRAGRQIIRSAQSKSGDPVTAEQLRELERKLGIFASASLRRQILIGDALRSRISIDRSTLGFSIGGGVPGEGDGDTVPAMLTPGEFVIKKASVAKYGSAFMDAVNRGLLPIRRAEGGPVGAASASGGISINLSLNGASASGSLNPGNDADALIEQLKLAGMVS